MVSRANESITIFNESSHFRRNSNRGTYRHIRNSDTCGSSLTNVLESQINK